MIEDVLNFTFYKGTDEYTDGPVEDELLKAVQENDDMEEILLNNSDWSYLYHLSLIRHNLLEWYDFKPNASILEIGSGCGAMTGLFCEKLERVVAIDLSKKRSQINAIRNKKYSNLEIFVGNFEDIELKEKFDYVTLIGVFEYSICYIDSLTPFEDMLAKVKKFLKPGGKLILAIENKYGLKYWNGAGEDHTGNMFDGIAGYIDVDRVRTFSKKQLTDLLVKAGFGSNEFYYPVPDYKMPSAIYSDNNLPRKGDLRNTWISYDRSRYVFFDEDIVFDDLCEDGRFDEFANSFLIFSSIK